MYMFIRNEMNSAERKKPSKVKKILKLLLIQLQSVLSTTLYE